METNTLCAGGSVFERTQQSKKHRDAVLCIESFGLNVFTGCRDGTIYMWNNECVWIKSLVGHKHSVNAMAVITQQLCSASSDRTIRIWNALTGKCQRTINGHTLPVKRLCVSTLTGSSQQYLFSGSEDQTICCWDPTNGACLYVYKGHRNWITGLLFINEHLISISEDKTMRLWPFQTPSPTPPSPYPASSNPVVVTKCSQIFEHATGLYSVTVWKKSILLGDAEGGLFHIPTPTLERSQTSEEPSFYWQQLQHFDTLDGRINSLKCVHDVVLCTTTTKKLFCLLMERENEIPTIEEGFQHPCLVHYCLPTNENLLFGCEDGSLMFWKCKEFGRWRIVRVLLIALKKEECRSCPLASLSLDILKEILDYTYGQKKGTLGTLTKEFNNMFHGVE